MLSRLQIAARLAARPLRTNAGVVRTFSTTPRALSDHAAPPSLVGQGAPPGTVPTDENQSTGLERLQILGHHEGIDVFDMAPLEMVRLGTMEDPIAIRSWVSRE
jgi:cytochrome c oxidase subunit 5b